VVAVQAVDMVPTVQHQVEVALGQHQAQRTPVAVAVDVT
jgi:hypothetical protein